jgi:hypothetical protein
VTQIAFMGGLPTSLRGVEVFWNCATRAPSDHTSSSKCDDGAPAAST